MDVENDSGSEDRRFLLVRAGGTCCAVPAGAVRRVVRNLACHPFPGEKSYFVGFSQFAGEPLAVLDLHSLITGEAPHGHRGATVILGRGSRRGRTPIGLAVDEAVRVETIATADRSSGTGSLVASTVTLDGDRVSVLETSVLFDESWKRMEAPDG